jgi:hypothetical protein
MQSGLQKGGRERRETLAGGMAIGTSGAFSEKYWGRKGF